MQNILVILILCVCVGYTARRLWKRLHAPKENPYCAGCPLKESCKEKCKQSSKHECCCG